MVASTVLDGYTESEAQDRSSLLTTIWHQDAVKPSEGVLEATRLGARIKRDLPAKRIEVIATLAYDADSGNYLMIKVDGDSTCVAPTERGNVLRALKVLGLEKDDSSHGQAAHDECMLLSQRELQVLQGVADGFSNKEIAKRLDIGENTAKRHLQRIFSKLGVFSRTQAVTFALTRGWITLGQRPTDGC